MASSDGESLTGKKLFEFATGPVETKQSNKRSIEKAVTGSHLELPTWRNYSPREIEPSLIK